MQDSYKKSPIPQSGRALHIYICRPEWKNDNKSATGLSREHMRERETSENFLHSFIRVDIYIYIPPTLSNEKRDPRATASS